MVSIIAKLQMRHLPSPLFVLQHLDEDGIDVESRPLAESLLLAISDLLFCPDFTAQSHKKNSPVSAQYPSTLHSHSCVADVQLWPDYPSVQLEPNTCQYSESNQGEPKLCIGLVHYPWMTFLQNMCWSQKNNSQHYVSFLCSNQININLIFDV